MLKEKEVEIISMILNRDNITIEELADRFGVSKRAIQYNINNINYYLRKENFSKISIKKSKIHIYSKEDLEKLIETNKKYNNLYKEERKLLIVLNAVFNKNGLNISNLSKRISVSRNTIKTDMNILEYDFVYKYSKGYFIEINNNKKIDILDKALKKSNLKLYIEEILDLELIHKIEDFLKILVIKMKLNINEEVYQKLLISIYTYISFPQNEKINNINFSEDLNAIKSLYKEHFGNEKSIDIISDMLIGLSLSDNFENWLDESFYLKKLIKKVSEIINIDLTEDKILYEFLFNHIRGCIYRLKKNINLSNTIYEKLVLEDDELFHIVRESLKEMENIFEIVFSSVEISLICYHFKASIERMQTSNKKRVILVCGLGYGTSRLLEYKLKEIYDIDIVDVLPSYMVNEEIAKNKSIDYIISTVDLDFDSIKINPTLYLEDYEKLEKIGFKRKKDKILIDELLSDIEKNYSYGIDKLKEVLLEKYSQILISNDKKLGLVKKLSPDRIIFKKSISSIEEGIKICGERLEKLGASNCKYTKEMINMYKKLGPYILINENVAMPHAKSESGVFKTDFVILLLENSYKFNNQKNINIFVSFTSIDGKEHIDILNDVYKLILDEKINKKLHKIKKYEELKEYINKNLIRKEKNV